MLEGFGLQTKTLNFHIGPAVMCVKEIGVWGPGCAPSQKQLAQKAEPGGGGEEVHVAGTSGTTQLCHL